MCLLFLSLRNLLGARGVILFLLCGGRLWVLLRPGLRHDASRPNPLRQYSEVLQESRVSLFCPVCSEASFSNLGLLISQWDRCLAFDCSSYCAVNRQVGFSQVVI
jgi:hypothetical protein